MVDEEQPMKSGSTDSSNSGTEPAAKQMQTKKKRHQDLSNESFCDRFIIQNRGIFVALFILPASCFLRVSRYIYDWYVFLFVNLSSRHDERVAHVSAQVREAASQKKKMCTARPGWHSMSLREGMYKKDSKIAKIEIPLRDVLELDEDNLTVRVEPLVTMGQLSRYLRGKGYCLQVTPELDDLTAGGLVNGFGVETSSHKYGLIQHTCTRFEVVVANGDVVVCTENDNPELFSAIPWSHGTLGFLVSVDFKIIKCKSHVKMTYIPCQTKEEYLDVFGRESRDLTNDFVEGLVYTKETGVIMKATLTDDVNTSQVNHIGYFWKPWFYKYVQSFLSSGETKTEYIPLTHYFHRHTRPLFWEMEEIIPFGDALWFRCLFGWLGPPHVKLLKKTQTETIRRLYEQHHVIQDMLIPMGALGDAINVFHDEVEVYPLWLCPMALLPSGDSGFMKPVMKDGQVVERMFVDLGAYGVPNVSNFEASGTLRRLEAFVRKVKGYQALYADCFMTRDEFHEMFDHTAYDTLRTRYGAVGAFPEIYDKISRAARR
eukprot:CAMPEP_0201702138 /NCGR_PEP_ID=MMETSP0578-20130828/35364_1 /ASSEMBLY_ACC=CAM_ASM_000663 /TAXON_ID=267565 /ORGANISM="Skeletonema grethea, Strain CCMP 1804" /LENGTH=542 /DNA_ID=CAMNT_0048189613 /DNA_START=147 /DNA_END=1775 /DNA_ORIENTATION=+